MLKNKQNLCRGCRSCSRKTESVYEKKTFESGTLELYKIYEILTGIEIQNENDEIFPKGFCKQCIESLVLLMKFRDKCIQSDQYFRNQKPKLENIQDVTADIPIFDEIIIKEEELVDEDEKVFIDKRRVSKSSQNIRRYDSEDDEDKVGSSLTDEDVDYIPESCSKYGRGNVKTTRTKKFSCGMCKKGYCTEKRLKSHLKSHDLQRSDDDQEWHDICAYCGKRFDSVDTVNRHMITQHKSDGTIQCDSCDAKLHSERYYKIHKILDHNDNNETIHKPQSINKKMMEYSGGDQKCRTDDSAEDIDDLNEMKIEINDEHLGGKKKKSRDYRRPYCCDICGKSWRTTQSHFREHMVKHDGPNLKCDICEKPYYSRGALIDHKRKHTGLKEFQCESCEYLSYSKKLLQDHIRSYHTLECPFKCSYSFCDFAAPTGTKLRQHKIKEHDNKDKYSCTICDAKFHAPRLLKLHVYEHNPDHICPTCGKKCENRKRFTQHMLLHSRDYPCPHCGKKFPTRVKVKRHLKTHAREMQVPVETLIANMHLPSLRLLVNYVPYASVSQVEEDAIV